LAYRLAPVIGNSRRFEMKRLAFVLGAAVAIAAVFAIGAAGAVKTARSTVTIGSGNGNDSRAR
jgi:hypothetical protein